MFDPTMDQKSVILTSGSVLVLALLLFGFFGPETISKKFSCPVFSVALTALLSPL
jgi:hypothetical protein